MLITKKYIYFVNLYLIFSIDYAIMHQSEIKVSPLRKKRMNA